MNKSELREALFKLIYSLEVQKEEKITQIDIYLQSNEYSENDANKIKTLAEDIVKIDNSLTEDIAKNLKSDWSIERISKVNLAILKVAIYEILHTETPYKVAINEAVELAKKYGEDSAPTFVNGVLASIVKFYNKDQEN